MTTSSNTLARFFGGIVVLLGLLLIGASQLASSINFPLSNYRLDSNLFLRAGAIIALLGLLLTRLSANAGLAVASSLLVATAAFALGYRPVRPGDLSLHLGHPVRVWQSENEWTELHGREDPLLGFSGAPFAVARQSSPHFYVTYRHDADGWRRLPSPPAGTAKGEIWFLGCSFTYGAEVEDEEVYVHRLAATAWPQVQVRNFAVSGWGTTNALLALRHQLEQRPAPRAVLYGWISHHRKRNYLRQSWFGKAKAKWIPYFELEDDNLRWLGLVPGATASMPDGPELDAIEVRLTVALIREMARLCAERGIPFVMLALDYDEENVLRELQNTPGLHVIDVSRTSRSYHPNGGHPTRVWHQIVARTIASSVQLAELAGMNELLAPDAIPAPPMGSWGLTRKLEYTGSASGTLHYPGAAHKQLRVTFSGEASGDPYLFVLNRHYSSLARGRVYSFEIEMRSSATRPLRFLLTEGRAPWTRLGLEGEIELTPEWRRIERIFVTTRDEREPLLMLLLGDSNRAVEIAGEPLLRELTGAAADEALATLARPGWWLDALEPAEAILDYQSADRLPPFRVRIKRLQNDDVWAVQLKRDGLALQAGRKYTLELRARAESPRPIQYAVTMNRDPWENLGLWGEMRLTTEWQTVRRTFSPKRDEEKGRLVLALGARPEAVDIATLRLIPDE